MAKWTDQGEQWLANIMCGTSSAPDVLYMGLYTHPVEPSETAELDYYNITAYADKVGGMLELTASSDATYHADTGQGYIRKSLTCATGVDGKRRWGVSGGIATYSIAMTWSNDNVTLPWAAVYGYFLTTSKSYTSDAIPTTAGGKAVLAVEHFLSAQTLEIDDQIKITPKITLQ
jgi:hypothetical protein